MTDAELLEIARNAAGQGASSVEEALRWLVQQRESMTTEMVNWRTEARRLGSTMESRSAGPQDRLEMTQHMANRWANRAKHNELRLHEALCENDRLRTSILNQAGDNLCWLKGDETKIPTQEEFLESCRRYHAQIASQRGELQGGRTIAQLEARIVQLETNAVDAHQQIGQIRKQAARECAEIAEAGAKQAALGVHRECEHDDCSEQRAIVKGARDTAKAIRERFGLEGK